MFWKEEEKISNPPAVASRKEREQCWQSRDNFFKCLDENDIIDSFSKESRIKIKSNCSKQDEAFNRDCVSSWVEFFKLKRDKQRKVDAYIKDLEAKGYKPIQLSETPSANTANDNIIKNVGWNK